MDRLWHDTYTTKGKELSMLDYWQFRKKRSLKSQFLDKTLEEALNESQVDASSVDGKADINDVQDPAESTKNINDQLEKNIKRKPNAHK
jgi:hypothetical protein